MRTPRTGRGQRGVVLLFALIAVVIMLIAAVAMIRSYNASLFMAGNIGFKRDMQTESELAIAAALAAFRTGPLNTQAARANSIPSANYSAMALAVNNQGVPTVLQTAATMAAAGYGTDVATDTASLTTGIKYRYVIDRLCGTVGLESTLGPGVCIVSTAQPPTGTSESQILGAGQKALCATCASAQPQSVVYRVSVRVEGPRNTVSFFQSTITVPST